MHPSCKVNLFPTEAQERARVQWFGHSRRGETPTYRVA